MIKKKLSKKAFNTPLNSIIALILLTCNQVHADVGELLWEDNFDDLNLETWTVDEGDGCDEGICGWGNSELQWYDESNAYIADVPGEEGNHALVLEAIAEDSNDYAFTSGKVKSNDKISVQYGMIEVRIQVPDVGIGLWPAAWMLGATTQSWPSSGEIDMMEMGHSESGRENAGFYGADINSYVGSNLIYYSTDACNDENTTCAASAAWETDNAYLSETELTNRFLIYRTYWTDTEIYFTIEDNGVETEMFDEHFTITDTSDEFQAPFYFLLNLAVGGNFTDASTNDEVTAEMPAKMYIDYVRIYELDGQGEVFIGNQTVAETGTFGVFTDSTETDNKLEAGDSSDIYVWNTDTVSDGTIEALEGDNVIAWSYSGSNEWFGGGINSRQVRDMSNFADSGEVSFSIKIPADVSFKVGIEDSYTNQNWVEFPANTTTYGLVRDGDWATATIPVEDLRGTLVALQSLEGLFYIASLDSDLPTDAFEMAIDDVIWSGGGDAVVTDTDDDSVDGSDDDSVDAVVTDTDDDSIDGSDDDTDDVVINDSNSSSGGTLGGAWLLILVSLLCLRIRFRSVRH